MKTKYLREPENEVVMQSLDMIIRFVEQLVYTNYEGTCNKAELRQLRNLYITRANDLALNGAPLLDPTYKDLQ